MTRLIIGEANYRTDNSRPNPEILRRFLEFTLHHFNQILPFLVLRTATKGLFIITPSKASLLLSYIIVKELKRIRVKFELTYFPLELLYQLSYLIQAFASSNSPLSRWRLNLTVEEWHPSTLLSQISSILLIQNQDPIFKNGSFLYESQTPLNKV